MLRSVVTQIIYSCDEKSKDNSLSACYGNKAASGREYEDDLMFCSNESNQTFKLENNTVYKLESIKYSTFNANMVDK